VSTDPVYLENAPHAEGKAAVVDCLGMKYAVNVANTWLYSFI